MSEAEEHTVKQLHLPWAITWIVFFLGWITIETIIGAAMMAGRPAPLWLYYVVLGQFLVQEGAAIGIKNRLGDTLSEFCWAFGVRGDARKGFATLAMLALGVRFFTLPWIVAGTLNLCGWGISWGLLCIGLITFLITHIYHLGERG